MLRRLTIVVVVAAVCAGCAINPSDSSQAIADKDVPFALLDPHAPAVLTKPGGSATSICLVEDDHLLVGQRQLDNSPRPVDILRSLSAVTDEEAARGLSTAISSAELITDVTIAGGTATVILADGATKDLTPDPLAAVAQIVCTLTDQPGIGLVRFQVGGSPVEIPRADGSLTDQPVTRDDYRTMLQ